jgi:hypothetical protein
MAFVLLLLLNITTLTQVEMASQSTIIKQIRAEQSALLAVFFRPINDGKFWT